MLYLQTQVHAYGKSYAFSMTNLFTYHQVGLCRGPMGVDGGEGGGGDRTKGKSATNASATMNAAGKRLPMFPSYTLSASVTWRGWERENGQGREGCCSAAPRQAISCEGVIPPCLSDITSVYHHAFANACSCSGGCMQLKVSLCTYGHAHTGYVVVRVIILKIQHQIGCQVQ